MSFKLEKCLIFLILFSAFRVSDFEYHKKDFIIPQSTLYVGELVFIFPQNNTDYFLGNKKFEEFSYQKFAVAPLTKKNSINVIAMQKRPSDWQERIFGRIYKAQVQELKINRPPLKEDNFLRLPSSVWKKVNKKEQLQKDRLKVKEVLSKNYAPRNPDCFEYPLKSIRVSKFSAPRSLPNGHSYYHSGLDLRSLWPEPIQSMGSGKVVLAEHMTAPGNLVIVYHGKGLFSRYMHLSKIDVKVGQEIEKGQSIGLSGSTGRVEAPHLHWEIIWKGNHANPEHFLPQWQRHCSLT